MFIPVNDALNAFQNDYYVSIVSDSIKNPVRSRLILLIRTIIFEWFLSKDQYSKVTLLISLKYPDRLFV